MLSGRGRRSRWAPYDFDRVSSVISRKSESSSFRRRRRQPTLVRCAIDARQPSYLWRPSLPVRQHASSRRNDALARPILGQFFLSRAARGRCSIALTGKLLRRNELAHRAAPLLALRRRVWQTGGAHGLHRRVLTLAAAGRREQHVWCGSAVWQHAPAPWQLPCDCWPSSASPALRDGTPRVACA
jgi:hypothetical protein